MFIRYGSYDHADGEVELSRSRESLMTEAMTPYAYLERWTLQGQLVGTDENDMDTKIAALETAYESDGQDVSLVLDGGGDSTISITSANTNGGVHVVSGPSFPENRNAAFVTFLNYTIVLEAEIPIANPALTVLRFEETIQRAGGGPRYGMREPSIGRPQRQLLKRNTIYRAVQTGFAVGLYSYPTPPNALWPQWLVEHRDLTTRSPKRFGTGSARTNRDYEVSWTYRFESPVQLIGGPHVWGVTYGG